MSKPCLRTTKATPATHKVTPQSTLGEIYALLPVRLSNRLRYSFPDDTTLTTLLKLTDSEMLVSPNFGPVSLRAWQQFKIDHQLVSSDMGNLATAALEKDSLYQLLLTGRAGPTSQLDAALWIRWLSGFVPDAACQRRREGE